MLNAMCSPEMSFNSKISEQPHAYVCYVDEEKESVPLSYIKAFPKTWREGWNKMYLHKVFWSPIDNDSPDEMLKRVAEIPVFEQGSEKNKPGYYRASVELVKDSLQELETELETGKRLSIGLSKYKFTSFDQGTSKLQEVKNSESMQQSKVESANKNSKSGKPVVLKRKKTESKKGKGSKKVVQSEQMDSLKTRLESRFPHITKYKEEDDQDKPLSELVNKTKSSVDSGSDEVVHGVKGRTPTNDLRESKTPTNPTLPSTVSQGHRSSSRKKFRRDLFPDSTSSSGEDGNEAKKVKLDPDFTPRKYAKVTEENLMFKKSLDKVISLNIKHQEKIITLEEKNEKLKKLVESLQKDISDFKEKCRCESHPKRMSSTKSSQSLACHPSSRPVHNYSQKSNMTDSKVPTKAGCEKEGKDSKSLRDMEVLKKVGDLKPADIKIHEEDTFEDSKPMEDLNDHGEKDENDEIILETVCQTVLTEGEKPDEWEGVPEDLQEILKQIPRGPKKDIKFVKELAIAKFGPEVLAASSILGTKKGSKSKNEAEKQAKPALDKTILESVKDLFHKRIAEEEKVSLQAASELDRAANTRFYDAIRDGQKWCRLRGYGMGLKKNIISAILFKELRNVK